MNSRNLNGDLDAKLASCIPGFRIAKYWNKLPENIVNAPSINSLKNRLNKHWKDDELYYANYKADISGSRVTYRETKEIQESGEEKP